MSFQTLPNEIKEKIFIFVTIDDLKINYFHLKDYKYILDYIIKKYNYNTLWRENTIKIPGFYIITRFINNIKKEQIVTIDSKYKVGSTTIFEYNYGIFGYHEGYAKIDSIRNLTKEENEKKKEGKLFSLPQQFYHSIPEY